MIEIPPIDLNTFLFNNVRDIVISITVAAIIASRYKKTPQTLLVLAATTPLVYVTLQYTIALVNQQQYEILGVMALVSILTATAMRGK